MGRIRCSGSPVVRAKTKTTTDRRVRATSDCSTRNRTNLSTELSAGQLVQEQVVHHGARVPLAERLGGRVRRVHVHDGQAVVLAAQPRVDVAHERVDLLPVGLAHDLGDHAVDLRVIDGVDRKSTRLNSSHITISYAVFCLKKKKST